MNIETSQEIDQISPALIKAQGQIKTVTLNKVNPHFRSKYADLSAIREACREPLAANDLAVIQAPATTDGKVTLTTMLLHTSGQWIKSCLELKPERAETPQAVGSAITYARRYTLASLLGIVADEDDDGNAASFARTRQALPTNRHQNNSVRGNDTQVDSKKIIFDKKNQKFVEKIFQELENKGCANHLEWIVDYLDGKEVRAGIVAEALEKRLEDLADKNKGDVGD